MIERLDSTVNQLQSVDVPLMMNDASHGSVEMNRAAALLDALRHAFVDHAGAANRVGELLDKRLVVVRADAKGGCDGFSQGEFLDALGSEVGIELIARDAP